LFIDSASMYRRYGKRLLDLTLTVIALACLWPLIVAVALLVRWRLGSPVIFAQPRAGRRGNPFVLFKFRSMTDAVDAAGHPLPDAQRLTRLGRCLRGLSLDELPQLVNVVRGEMSLVGPRPLYVEYLQHYTPFQARRHDVAPGITGWAQIRGRNAISWEEKFQYDVWYVDHCSLWLDLRILWGTFMGLFRPRGIAAAGHATMPRFTGSPSQHAG
jgi:lipopolysaccharide/colanic/teichoic acid biosynthesis glycosyltransferase